MKRIFVVLACLFVVALAVMVGKRMSADAMAVVVGIVCGVSASIPTSLLMLMLVRRREEHEEQRRWAGYPSVPPIMIVNPPAQSNAAFGSHGPGQLMPPFANVPARQFHILGMDDRDEELLF